ncbi:unnamed protein product [[Candida] boidinii]|nr:unnamed protein product [[Candida] boidinii]
MSTIIIASGIPSFVTDSKIEEFFSFCGKIKSIKQVDSSSGADSKTKEIQVEFNNSSAVSTALLLNGAELEGGVVSVKSLDDSNVESTDTKSDLQDSSDSTSAGTSPSPSPPIKNTIFKRKIKRLTLRQIQRLLIYTIRQIQILI